MIYTGALTAQKFSLNKDTIIRFAAAMRACAWGFRFVYVCTKSSAHWMFRYLCLPVHVMLAIITAYYLLSYS